MSSMLCVSHPLRSRPDGHAPPHADMLDALLVPPAQRVVRDEPESLVHLLDGHLRMHERQPGPSPSFPLHLALRNPRIRRVDLVRVLCRPLQRRVDQLPCEPLAAVLREDGDAGEFDVRFVREVVFGTRRGGFRLVAEEERLVRRVRRGHEADHADWDLSLVSFPRLIVTRRGGGGVQHPVPAPRVVRVDLVRRVAALLGDEDGVAHAQGVGEEGRVGRRVWVRGGWVGELQLGGRGAGRGRGVLAQVCLDCDGGHGLVFCFVVVDIDCVLYVLCVW